MAKTLLPLKQILEGDQRSLITSLREVSQHDRHRTPAKATLDINAISQLILDDTHIVDFSQASAKDTGGHLEQFLTRHSDNWDFYQTTIQIPLFLADHIVSSIYRNNVCHPVLEETVGRLSLLLTLSLAQRTEAICDTSHPLRLFIERLFLQVSTWEYSSGRPGKALPELLCSFIHDFEGLDINSNDVWSRLTAKIEELHKSDAIRTQKLEKRLRESTDVDPRMQQKQQLVSRWISRKLNQKSLPEETASFIRLQLIGDLQYLLIQKGENHETWSHWQKLLHLLSWIFKNDDSEAFSNKVKSVLMPVVSELDERYTKDLASPEKYDHFFGHLTENMIALIQGQPVPTVMYAAPEQDLNETVIKQAVISDHSYFNEGDWFLFDQSGGSTLRAKLVLKAPHSDSLVFANHLGKKVHECDFQSFALQLAAGGTRKIKQSNIFKQGLFTALKVLELYHRKNLRHQKQEFDQQQHQKFLAAEKARQEAEQLRELRQQQELQQQQQIERRAAVEPDIIRGHSEKLRQLVVGSWVVISDEQGSQTNCKLSVRLNSTNRFIFTDRLGQPTAEHTLNELIDLMIDNRFEIISTGASFDNKLEKIVQGLRKPG